MASRSLWKIAVRGEGYEVRAKGTAQTWGPREVSSASQQPTEDQGDLCLAFWKSEAWRFIFRLKNSHTFPL